jgi:hypothetical protein
MTAAGGHNQASASSAPMPSALSEAATVSPPAALVGRSTGRAAAFMEPGS